MGERLEAVAFADGHDEDPDVAAHVKPYGNTIYLDQRFWSQGTAWTPTGAPKPLSTQAGTVVHEASHFSSTGATEDHVYGDWLGSEMADRHPDWAQENADNYKYFAQEA